MNTTDKLKSHLMWLEDESRGGAAKLYKLDPLPTQGKSCVGNGSFLYLKQNKRRLNNDDTIPSE